MAENQKSLHNLVAIVTGGSRGVGRGVAIGLGEFGATIFITGRNTRDLEKTASLVTAEGGHCIPLKCDHRNDEETRSVFEEVNRRGLKVALLVNCAWGGYEDLIENGKFTWTDKFWQQPIWRWDKVFAVGVRTIFINSKFALELLDFSGPSLIVNISFWAAQKYVGNLIYGASKAVADKLTADMAHELRDTDINVISLYPGLVRTEEVMKAAEYLDLNNSESPQFIGRVIAKLFQDPACKHRTGKPYVAAKLAQEYGIYDIDGSQPRALGLLDV